MRRLAITAAAVAGLSAFALGGSFAHAQDAPPDTTAPPAPPAADASSTVTLALLGSPLMVDVTTDAGGGLVDVTLSPSTGYDPAKVKPNRVAFVNEEGGVAVKVSAKHGGERVEARAGSLEDISGAGGWSGDIFDSGVPTTVNFTIGAGADGGPDITGISVESSLANTVGDVVRNGGGDDEHGSFQSAKVTIEFTANGQTRWLTIKAVLVTSDDGETRSALKISLSRIKGRLQDGAPAVGAHSWSGSLCDGTAASFTYNVSDTGEVTDVVPTPEADVRADGRKARVAFSDHERISIKVRGEGEEMTVGTSERIRCDRVDPTVNGETVDLPDDDNGDHNGWGGGDRNRDDDGDHNDGDHNGWGDRDGGSRDGGSRDGGDDKHDD